MASSLENLKPVSFTAGTKFMVSGWEEPSHGNINRRILSEIQTHLEPVIVKVGSKAVETLLTVKPSWETFQIDPSKLYHHYENEYKHHIKQNCEKLVSEGFTREETSAIIKKVLEISGKFIAENRDLFLFSFKEKADFVLSWSQEATLREYLFCSQNLGELKVMGEVIYHPDDLNFLSTTPTVTCQKLSCFLYTLLRSRELNAKEWILKNDEIHEKIVDLLELWGYKPSPTPHMGDLVLYFNGGESLPTHMGRMVENGRVESKLGYVCPYTCIHGLLSVPKNYGNRIVFMSKIEK